MQIYIYLILENKVIFCLCVYLFVLHYKISQDKNRAGVLKT